MEKFYCNGKKGICHKEDRLCGDCEFFDNRGGEYVEVPDSEIMEVFVSPGSGIPTRAHKNDAGLDLYATKGGWIMPKSRKTFGTGCHAMIKPGFVGFLTSKSGMMAKQGITSRGTIDSGYTGEIKAVLFNHSWLPVKIKAGQKITQMVIIPIQTPEIECVDKLDDTARGEGGFGSTGQF